MPRTIRRNSSSFRIRASMANVRRTSGSAPATMSAPAPLPRRDPVSPRRNAKVRAPARVARRRTRGARVEAMDEAGSMRKPQGPVFLAIDSRNREPSVVRAVDVRSGVDPQHVLVPSGIGHGRVSGHDTAPPSTCPSPSGTDQNPVIHLYTHELGLSRGTQCSGSGVSNDARARQRPWISAVSARADSRAA